MEIHVEIFYYNLGFRFETVLNSGKEFGEILASTIFSAAV